MDNEDGGGQLCPSLFAYSMAAADLGCMTFAAAKFLAVTVLTGACGAAGDTLHNVVLILLGVNQKEWCRSGGIVSYRKFSRFLFGLQLRAGLFSFRWLER